MYDGWKTIEVRSGTMDSTWLELPKRDSLPQHNPICLFLFKWQMVEPRTCRLANVARHTIACVIKEGLCICLHTSACVQFMHLTPPTPTSISSSSWSIACYTMFSYGACASLFAYRNETHCGATNLTTAPLHSLTFTVSIATSTGGKMDEMTTQKTYNFQQLQQQRKEWLNKVKAIKLSE